VQALHWYHWLNFSEAANSASRSGPGTGCSLSICSERRPKCVRCSSANDKPEFVGRGCSRQAGHGLRSWRGPVTHRAWSIPHRMPGWCDRVHVCESNSGRSFSLHLHPPTLRGGLSKLCHRRCYPVCITVLIGRSG